MKGIPYLDKYLKSRKGRVLSLDEITHVGAVADHVVKDLKTAGVSGIRVEGIRQGDWVLIDAGDVIVHVFRPEVRTFYGLEKMWSAGRPDGRRAS